MNEISGKDIKKNTKLVIISVIALTLVMMSVSYSAFFSVQSQATVQQIKAGVLDVIIDNSSYITEDLLPSDVSVLPSAANSSEHLSQLHGSITLLNEGTLPSEYSITISADTPTGETAIDFQYINVGVVDVSNNVWHNFGTNESPIYYTALTTLGNNNNFPILRDTIATNSSRVYRVYVWLSENTPVTEIGNYVYLKLNVKSMTIDGRIES